MKFLGIILVVLVLLVLGASFGFYFGCFGHFLVLRDAVKAGFIEFRGKCYELREIEK